MTGPNEKTFTCTSCVSRSRCVLSAVEPEVLAISASRVQWVRFERGGTIIHEGTLSTGWAILCQGRARLTVSAEQGKRLLLRFCHPGELILSSLLVTHDVSATAMSPSVVRFVNRESVCDLGRRYPEALLAAHHRLAHEQGRLVRRLVDLAYGSTRQRLVRVLLELGEEHGAPEGGGVRIDILLSLRDLAEMIGASRQATCKELQLLRAKGLIEVVWPRVFLSDLEHLRQLS